MSDAVLRQDKKLHFVAGVGIALFAGMLESSAKGSFIVGVGTAMAAGAIKELFDLWARRTREESQHGAEWADFWATVAGGFIGATLSATLRMALG